MSSIQRGLAAEKLNEKRRGNTYPDAWAENPRFHLASELEHGPILSGSHLFVQDEETSFTLSTKNLCPPPAGPLVTPEVAPPGVAGLSPPVRRT
jgi:hypothetical protein